MHKCPHKLIKTYCVLSVYCLWRFEIQSSTQFKTITEKDKEAQKPRSLYKRYLSKNTQPDVLKSRVGEAFIGL